MNFQTVQDFLKVLNICLEFLQAIESPQSFRIYFYEFSNIPELPEGPKYFSGIFTSLKKSPKIQNIFFYEFTKKNSRNS